MGRFLVGEPDAGFSEVGAELVTLGNRGFKGALGVGLLPGQVGDLLVIPGLDRGPVGTFGCQLLT